MAEVIVTAIEGGMLLCSYVNIVLSHTNAVLLVRRHTVRWDPEGAE